MSVVHTTRARELDCTEHRCDGCNAVLFVVFPQLDRDGRVARTQLARGYRFSETVVRSSGMLQLPDGEEIEMRDHALVCLDTFVACEAQAIARGIW